MVGEGVSVFMNRVVGRSVSIVILALLFSSVNLAFLGGAASAAVPPVGFVDYAQCSNDQPPSVSTSCPGGWINGILNPNNSHYAEDQVTPQRAEVSYPAGAAFAGATLTFRYQTKKGGINAYDSLATWNTTQTAADRSQGLNAADVVAGAATTLAMVADPLAAGHELGGRAWTMYGGTLTASSAITHDCTTATTPCSGDDLATVTVTYDVPASASERKVQLLFGGHLAPSTGPRGWGIGLGAGSVSGGPYHIKWDLADGASIGNRDNQIMSGAVLAPALAIAKTADAATVTAGSPIGFTVTVSNTGAGSATNVVMTDTLPTNAGLSWTVAGTTGTPTCGIATGVLTCTKASLASASNFTVHVTSPTTAATCGTVSNSAGVIAGANSAGPASASVTVNCPDVSISKSARAASVDAGSAAIFDIVVTAGGTGSSTGVVLTDDLSGTGLSWAVSGADASACSPNPAAAVLTCTFGTMASGTTKSVTLTATTSRTDCPTGLSNTATVAATVDSNPNNNSSTATVAVRCGDVVVTKTADAGTVNAGQPIGFLITVTNNGVGTATGVSVTDTLPTNGGTLWTLDAAGSDAGCTIASGTLSCSFGSLAPTASKHVHLVSPTTAATCGTVSNHATASTTNDGGGAATATVTVNCQPDVSIAKSGNGPVVAGGTATFTITVSAGGTGSSSNVTLSDSLPAGTWSLAGTDAASCTLAANALSCDFGTLAQGSSRSITVSRTTAEGDCPNGIANTATVSATGDTNSENNTATAQIAVTCQPNVSIAKSGSAAVSAGGSATFTIVVTAGGTGPSTNVAVSDSLPAGTWTLGGSNAAECGIASGTLSCTFGTMASGATKTVTLSRTTTAQDCPALRNSATVTASGDSNAADNIASASVVVNCASSLAIVKTADAASVAAGSMIGFVVTVSNNGNATATNVQVTDALPTGTGISWMIDAAGSDSGCAIGSGTLTCNYQSIAPGASKHVHVMSTTSASSCGATYTNTATATANANEGVAASATTSLVACPPPTPQSPQLTISKSADAPFVTASASTSATVGFTITVTNVGPVSTSATLTDMPVTGANPSTPAGNAGTAGMVWTIDQAGSDNGCTLPNATLTCSFGVLSPGQSRHVHIRAVVLGRATAAGRNDNCGQRVTNVATVQFGAGSIQSNQALEDVNCVPATAAGRLTITKFSDNNANALQDSGEPNLAGWTFMVKNNATGEMRVVTTDLNGQAVVEDLAFGDYTVTEVSCMSPCDMTRWLAVGHRIGTAGPVKDGKASATIAINAADQSIAFANVSPRLPSTSTLPDTDRGHSSLGLVLFVILAGLLALQGGKGGHLVSTIGKFVRREEGQGLVEYALIIAIIAIAVIVAMIFLRDQISNIFSVIGNNLT